MIDERNETLIEAAASAYRERDSLGSILPSPAWRDLAPEERVAAFDLQLRSRELEQILDPRNLSTTVRAVLGRIVRAVE
jgi:hypothetical protein